MTRLTADRLPDEVVHAFDGHELHSKVGRAYLLVTVDPDGTPRACMLSAGEVLVTDETTIRVALWPGTRTGENLERGGRVLFCYVARAIVTYAKGRGRSLESPPGFDLSRFEIAVESVESDEHPRMPVTRSIEFTLEDLSADEVVRAWERQLRGLAEP